MFVFVFPFRMRILKDGGGISFNFHNFHNYLVKIIPFTIETREVGYSAHDDAGTECQCWDENWGACLPALPRAALARLCERKWHGSRPGSLAVLRDPRLREPHCQFAVPAP